MRRPNVISGKISVCYYCGRPLEHGEVCMCRKRETRDGYRASCGRFESRTSYQGRYYIICGGHKYRFDDKNARERHYIGYCCACADGEECPIRKEAEKNERI